MPRLGKRTGGSDVSCVLGTVLSTLYKYFTKMDKSYEVVIRISISQMEPQKGLDCSNITVWIEIRIYGSIQLLHDCCIGCQYLRVSRILPKVPSEDKQAVFFNNITCGQGALEILVRRFYHKA